MAPLTATTTARARERAAAKRFGEAAMLQAAEAVLVTHGVTTKLEFTRRAGHAERDAWLRIGRGKAAVRYPVEVTRGPTLGTLGAVLLRLRDRGGKGLIVADHVPPNLADTLRDRGIAFVDLTGNAWIQQPGIVLQVVGKRPEQPVPEARPARVLQPAGLRVVFALLCRPELVNAPVRDIAKAAGVAHGTVGWVLRDLKKMGHVVELGRRPGARGRARTRRLEQPRRLLDLWVQAYPGQLRPRLRPRRYQATQPGWWRGADLAQYGLALGGEAAGERLTQHLKPEKVTLYAVGGGNRLVHQDYILLNDVKGDVEILDAFWNFPPPPELRGVVPPLLVYADLLAIGDDRCIETARIVHDHYLARLDGKD